MKYSPLLSRNDQNDPDTHKQAKSPGETPFLRFLGSSSGSLRWSVGLFFIGGTITASLLLGFTFWLKSAQNQNKEEIRRATPLLKTMASNSRPQLGEAWGETPLSFEANQGQADGQVKYLARGRGYGLFLTSDEAVFALRRPNVEKTDVRSTFSGELGGKPPVILKMKMVGANRNPSVAGAEPLTSKSNYFIGNDPRAWQTDIPHFAKVEYKGVYPGIDLVYYGNQRQLEYDFVVKPGADPSEIALAFEGARQVRITDSGDLVLATEAGEIRQQKPVVYQQVDGEKRPVEGRYVMKASQQVGFEVAEYDRSRELVIDPVLIYATYLGGSALDFGNAIEADGAGFVYVTGITYSDDFPTKSPFQFNKRGLANAFVSKFNPDGALVYSTFLGGEGEDVGFAITSDSSGNAYFVGSTNSGNFPTSNGAAQTQKRGLIDLFVTKLSSAGNSLMSSSYLGGQNDDVGNTIAVDSSGNIYVAGLTISFDFPTVSPFQIQNLGGTDAFIAKFNSDSSQIVFSTHLGGNGLDTIFGIAVDGTSAVYVTGFTTSPDFPTKNPAQASFAGRVDGFVTKLNAAGTALVYSTYFGGSHDDGGYGIGVDSASNAYITGFTISSNFPTKNPFQANNGGGNDAVVLKLDAAGALAYASYLGGSGDERAFDLLAESNGEAFVVGRTDSSNFPVKNAIQSKLNTGLTGTSVPRDSSHANRVRSQDSSEGEISSQYGRDGIRTLNFGSTSDGETKRAERQSATSVTIRDGFITKLSAAGSILHSSYLGGSDEEVIYGIASNHAGHFFVTGLTASGNFPTKNPVQAVLRGVADGFVARIAETANTQTSVSAASFVAGPVAPDEIVAIFGAGLAPGTGTATTLPLPTSLGGITLNIIDSNDVQKLAPLFHVSPTQINFLIPSDILQGPATLSVESNGVIISTENVQVASLAPGLFSANSNGRDVVSGVILRVKANGSQQYEPLMQFDSGQNKFLSLPIDLGIAGDQVYLVLFATGIRNRSALGNVTASIGGLFLQPVYAGPQGTLVGLDQVNILVTQTLAGRGEVDLNAIVDGKTTNTVKVNFK